MEDFKRGLAEKIKGIELLSHKTDDCGQEFGKKFETYIKKARDILKKKNVINPKPQKKLMRAIAEDETDEEEPEKIEFVAPNPPKAKPLAESSATNSSDRESLRPVRSAKITAKNNLKEAPVHTKLRNDNNVAVVVKKERVSTAINKSGSRDSLKENSQPSGGAKQQYVSVDEGVQLSAETDVQSERGNGRSMSVEFIPTKSVEIDITTDDGADKMPPPPLPAKKKLTRQKQQKQASKQSDVPADPSQPIPMRVTRSKIKTEKPSIDRTVSAPVVEKSKDMTDDCSSLLMSASKAGTAPVNETAVGKKGKNKKYPLPIIVKVERLSNVGDEQAPQADAKTSESQKTTSSKEGQSIEVPALPSLLSLDMQNNDLPMNETVTISKNTPVNQTVTLETHLNVNETITLEKNGHDSLMTDDNDDEASMTVNEPPAPKIPAKSKAKSTVSQQPSLPSKLKKNEVFNPYLSSPVKQKVQAFEKHSTINTPDVSKSSSSKYQTLKAGTPSKIGVYSTAKTTPLSNAKQRYMSAVASSASSSSSSSSASKTSSATKKYTSLVTNQESDEKKKQREEKQQKVQLQREAIEKQKREQTLQQQREREEKFRKIMMEKEEQKRMEALKKKQLKENQEKKYAEEKLKKDEFLVPKEPQSASKDNSLYIKMQKQIMMDKASAAAAAAAAQQQKKKLQKGDSNGYSFDMLHTDDSTDDESKPSKKRPDPPQWSRKQYRSKQIQIQSFTNSSLLDILFSSQPITVDLKQIFPSIEPRKLVRNSSAVWNTPPRYSQIPKY